MNHTPGPWGVFGIAPTCIGAKDDEEGNCLGRQVAITYGFFGTIIGHEESIANARLIAAAPELLEVCETVLARYDFHAGVVLKEQLRAAVIKAKGRSEEDDNP